MTPGRLWKPFPPSLHAYTSLPDPARTLSGQNVYAATLTNHAWVILLFHSLGQFFVSLTLSTQTEVDKLMQMTEASADGDALESRLRSANMIWSADNRRGEFLQI